MSIISVINIIIRMWLVLINLSEVRKINKTIVIEIVTKWLNSTRDSTTFIDLIIDNAAIATYPRNTRTNGCLNGFEIKSFLYKTSRPIIA